MNDSRWQAIWELFFAALEQPPEGRNAFLESRADADHELRREVQELLAAHAADDPRLSRSPVLNVEAAGMADDAAEIRAGEQIGPYRIVQQIGEGGMGRVYEAEQERPVRRRVALKVVKRGMDTREVVRRFELERQALALMSHPGIARVFDAGSTDDGRPYFVMELVPGVPITEFCDRERLSLRQRLQLFVVLCDAVQHAHQKGVVHRDLKASNVLIVSEGSEPAPKVIDFGIAKAVGTRLGEETLHTALGVIMGTPAYMSPEQAALGAIDVDARTDVYSLCALLYELAVGDPPFPSETLRGSDFLEALKVIRERDALRPSVRIMGLSSEQLAERARARAVRTRELVRDLAEIDWIVMHGLAKERGERYQTPGELAADVERWLSGLPLRARPPGGWYRARKFISRHRFGVAAASVIGALLITFAVSMAVQSVRLERALANTEAQRERAEDERNRAEDVSDFLVDILRLPDPSQGNRADMNIREALANAESTIATRFEQQPRTKATLLTTIGTVYRELGDYERAQQSLNSAVTLARTLEPGDPAELGRALNAAGELAHDKGDLDTAERNYREALPLLKQQPHRLIDESVVLNNLASIAIDRGEPGVAEEPARAALEIRTAKYGPGSRETGQSLRKLGRVLSKLGRWREAEDYIREGIAVEKKSAPRDTSWMGAALNDLHAIYQIQGNYRGSVEVLNEALEIYRATMGNEHPYTAVTLLNLGRVQGFLGQYALAESTLAEAAAIYQHLSGVEHPNHLRVLAAQAELELQRGRYASAERRLKALLAVDARVFGPKHRDTAGHTALLAIATRELGRPDEAVKLHLDALGIVQASLGPDHLSTAAMNRALALTYVARGSLPEAEAAALEAARVERLADLADRLPAANTLSVLGWVRHAQGRDAEAAKELAEAQRMQVQLLGAELPDTALTEYRLGVVERAQGEQARSLQHLTHALAAQRRLMTDSHPAVALTLLELGELRCANGAAEAGRADLEGSIRTLTRALDGSDPRVRRARSVLGSCANAVVKG
jgi:serine/threonine protein kinase